MRATAGMSTGPESEAAATDHRLPLYQQLRDRLARRIAGGDWKPGTALPAEAQLAQEHGVALGTMRRAIELLVDEGLVERRQGSGTYVRHRSFQSSLFRFFRFQTAAGTPDYPESRILRRVTAVPPAEIARRLALKPGQRAIRMARLRLIAGTPFLVEDIWVPLARFRSFLARDLAEIGPLLYPAYEEHAGVVIASAEETLSVAAADAAVARPLRLAAGAPVVVIERLAFDIERRPVEWRRSHGRADLFQYRIEIR